jgi:hypothetical protein
MIGKLGAGLFQGDTESIFLTPHYTSRIDKRDGITGEILRRQVRDAKKSFFPCTISDDNTH